MFFKKKETEIDDDFDNMDAFDDFDIEDSGFNDSTPKSGARQAISTITGGFFSGIKSSLLDPTLHRKILKDSLPDGYVAHYDDVTTILKTTKSLYNTADEEARNLSKTYANELKPHVKAWDQKKKSKLSGKMLNLVGGNEDTGGDIKTQSAQEIAFSKAANDIFGNQMAQQTSDGIQRLTEQGQRAQTVSAGLQQQNNEILTNVANSLNAQSSFTEQVALKWQKKTLEIQFRQYYTARKQLDVQLQSHEYMQATLPNIVKNTSLPDAVKLQTSELAGQMFTQKWIGALSDKSHQTFGGMVTKFGENLKGKVTAKAQELSGQSGLIGAAGGMFNNDSGFGQTPQQMLLEALGGAAGSKGVNYLAGKATDKIKERVGESGEDFEKHNENLKLLKYQMPAIMASMSRNGTGNDLFDKILAMGGAESLTEGRSKLLHGNLENDLQSQALFDLETKKSITYTIPTLLSEIHSELFTVRNGMGFGGDNGPKDDDKLRMDWSSGQLNSRGNIKTRMKSRLYGEGRRANVDDVTYDMLAEMGFKKETIAKDKAVISESGEELLSERDLNFLSIAIKAASYDNTTFFDIEELANGNSPLIRDDTARANIARFFTEHMGIDQSGDSLTHSTDLIATKKRRAAKDSLGKVKNQNSLQEALNKHRLQKVEEDTYKQYASTHADLLVETGGATLNKDGVTEFDPLADAMLLYQQQHPENLRSQDLHRGFQNNEFGGGDRANLARNAVLDRELRAAAEKKQKIQEAKDKADAKHVGEKVSIGQQVINAAQGVREFGTKASDARRQAAEYGQNLTELILPPSEENPGDAEPTLTYGERFKNAATYDNIKSHVVSINNKIKESVDNFDPKELRDTTRASVVNFITALSETATEAVAINNVGLNYPTGKPLVMDGEQDFSKFDFFEPTKHGGVHRKPSKTVDELRREIRLEERDAAGVWNIDAPNKPHAPSALQRRMAIPSHNDRNDEQYLNLDGFKPKQRSGLKPVTSEGNTKPPSFRTDPNWIINNQTNATPVHDTTPVPLNGPRQFRGNMDDISYADKQSIAAYINQQSQLINERNEEDDGTQGLFFGGTVGSNDGLVRNYSDGGTITGHPGQDKFIKSYVRRQLKLKAKKHRREGMAGSLQSAWDREEKLGGKPQTIVASVGEEVLSNTNGDAQIFRHVKENGQWDGIKSSVNNKLAPVTNQGTNFFKALGITEDGKALSSSVEGDSSFVGLIRKLGSDITTIAKDNTELLRRDIKNNLVDLRNGDPEAMEGVSGTNVYDTVKGAVSSTRGRINDMRGQANMLDDDIEGIGESFISEKYNAAKNKLNEIDQEKLREKLMLGAGNLKGYAGTAASGLGSMYANMSIPTFGDSTSTSQQLAEMIRLTGHIAINTGSSPDVLESTDPEVMDGISSGGFKGFLSSVNKRFKRRELEEGVEPKESRWSKLKGKFKRNKPDNELDEVMSDEEIDESTPEGKKKGLLRRMIGGMFGLSWGTTKLMGRGVLGSVKGAWWTAGKVGKLTGKIGKGLFGSKADVTDVYLKDGDNPVLLARDMEKGLYYDRVTGDEIKEFNDIKGAVIDENGNILITQDDYENRLVEARTIEGRRSLVVKGIAGSFKLSAMMSKGILKGGWLLATTPLKFAFKGLNKTVDHTSGGYIDKDIYVKGDDEPRIRAALIGKGEYFTVEKESVETYDQIKDGVYDAEGNLIMGPADIKKGLITPDGTPIGKLLGAGGKVLGFGLKATGAVIGASYKVSKAILGGIGSLVKGGFNLVTGAGKGLWNKLKGRSNGTEADELLIEAQAVTVDKLESIRIILDERMAIPEKAMFNDKDKDGKRDGSYWDQMKAKLEARKAKAEAKKKADEDKRLEGVNSDKPDMAESIANGMGMFFSRKILFAALGGLVAANFGPQIATGIWSGLRAILPGWAGGYSKEKKDEIKADGGVMKHMMTTGTAAGASGKQEAQTQPTVDAEGNPIPASEQGALSPEESEGMSTGTKFALGAATTLAAPRLLMGAAKGAFKAPGLLATGVRLASNKTGLTARMGMSGMGKVSAVKHMLKGGGRGAATVGRGLMSGTGAVRSAVASNGFRQAAMMGLRALPALAATPIGLGVIAVATVAVIAYAGYKLYKHLTKKDNHLVTYRMAQYGYKMDSSNEVTKILDLEAYLDGCAIKATSSAVSKLSKSAKAEEALKIMGVDSKNEKAVLTFFDWYYYRFKPVYLSWKTLAQRATGSDDIGKIDERLLMEDKLKIIEDVNFKRDIENPYDVMVSPFKTSPEVQIDHETVISIKDKMIKQLSRIDVNKHDDKIRASGGGRKVSKENIPSITEATASKENKGVTQAQRNREAKVEAEKGRKDRQQQMVADERAAKQEQGWFSKFMVGDKSKKEEGGVVGWGKRAGETIKGWFGGGEGGEGGTYDASSKTLNLTAQDIEDISKVTSTEVAGHLKGDVYNKQAGAIVDTILNRVASDAKSFRGKTVRDILNQKNQFSAISGNKHSYGSVQNMPTSAMQPRAKAFVAQYLQGRVDGTIKPVINGDLNYLNPAVSGQKAMRTWGKVIIDQANKSGQVYGTGDSKHFHGTSTELQNHKPHSFKIGIGGKVSGAQNTGTGAKKDTSNGNSAFGSSGANAVVGKTAATPKPSVNTKAKASPGPYATGARGATSFDGAFTKAKTATASKPGSGVLKPTTAAAPKEEKGILTKAWDKAKQTHNEMSGAMSAPANNGKPAKSDGNMVAPEMTKVARPAKAAAYATAKAKGGSTGWCARYVRTALQHGGYKFTGVSSAYMYATQGVLTSAGFVQIASGSSPQIGDVVVTDKSSASLHGHICIYNGSIWVSDYKQAGGPNPYNNKSLRTWHYRDKQFLNGAPTGGDMSIMGADGEYGASAPSAPPPYQIKFEDQMAKLKARKAKRDELIKKSNNKSAIKDTNSSFKNTRGKANATSVKAKIDAKNGFDDAGSKVNFKLDRYDMTPVDMTPSGYEPKERESTVVTIDENGVSGNSTGPKVSTENLRLENVAQEEKLLGESRNAQAARDKIEQQNQEQVKRLEVQHQKEVASATEYKVVQEKQQKLAESDSSISQKQLEVQTAMARDIRRMTELMDKMYLSPSAPKQEAGTSNVPSTENRTIKPSVPHRQMETVATMEPVSMKIN